MVRAVLVSEAGERLMGMADMTPEARSERARAAARARWAKADATERAANGRRGQAGLLRKLTREVDPEGNLSEAERRQLVADAQRVLMTRVSRSRWPEQGRDV